jgi:hypothetical protein
MRKFLLLSSVFLAVLVGVAGLVAVTTSTDALEANVALHTAISEWEALGGSPDLPQAGPVAVKDNAAILYGRAFAMLRRRPGEQELHPLADAARLAEGVKEHSTVVGLAHEAAARPACVWEQDGAPDHVDVTRLVNVVVTDALTRINEGDVAAGLADFEALRAMARHLRTDSGIELFMYSLMVESNILHSLMFKFRDLDLPIEHAPSLLSHEDYRELARQALLRGGAEGLRRIDEQGCPQEWVIESKVGFLRWMCEQVRALREPYTPNQFPGSAGQKPQWASLIVIYPDRQVIFETETRARFLRVAADLRAWRAEHGEYPDSWQMPTDPLSGKPLHYRRTEKGFELSSEADPTVRWSWR